MSALEKGETSTALAFVNATGLSTKPFIIHKDQKVQQAWKNDEPQSYSLGASTWGFLKWMVYEVTILSIWERVHPDVEEPGPHAR